MSKLDTAATAILFYAGWFGCIFAAKYGFFDLAFVFPALLIGFLLVTRNLSLRIVAKSLLIAFVGAVFDALAIHFGLVETIGRTALQIPVWLIALWLLFAFSMMKIGKEFKIPIWTAVILGFIFGPLTYKSGEAFEVFSFANYFSLCVYAVFWAVMFPVVIKMSRSPI